MKGKVGLLLFGTLVASAALFVALQRGHRPGNVRATPLARSNQGAQTARVPTLEGQRSPSTIQEERTPEIERRVKSSAQRAFESAENYAELANQLLPAAETGDPDAQYYLSRALEYCDQILEMRTNRETGNLISVDEVRARYNRIGVPDQKVEYAVRSHVLCRDFAGIRERYGGARDWLETAASLEQPSAQASLALALFVELERPSDYERGRALLRDAITSRDPTALWLLGEALSIRLGPFGNRPKTEAIAYQLLACEYGYDCSAKADWVRETCYLKAWSCTDGSDGVDYLKEFLGADAERAVAIAEDIQRKMDNGQWEALGLETPM